MRPARAAKAMPSARPTRGRLMGRFQPIFAILKVATRPPHRPRSWSAGPPRRRGPTEAAPSRRRSASACRLRLDHRGRRATAGRRPRDAERGQRAREGQPETRADRSPGVNGALAHEVATLQTSSLRRTPDFENVSTWGKRLTARARSAGRLDRPPPAARHLESVLELRAQPDCPAPRAGGHAIEAALIHREPFRPFVEADVVAVEVQRALVARVVEVQASLPARGRHEGDEQARTVTHRSELDALLPAVQVAALRLPHRIEEQGPRPVAV